MKARLKSKKGGQKRRKVRAKKNLDWGGRKVHLEKSGARREEGNSGQAGQD